MLPRAFETLASQKFIRPTEEGTWKVLKPKTAGLRVTENGPLEWPPRHLAGGEGRGPAGLGRPLALSAPSLFAFAHRLL